MHLCNLFPKNRSLILSFFSGTFSVSSFIFKVFQLLNKPDSHWFSSSALFVGYIILITPFFVVGAFVWPNKAFEAPGAPKKMSKIVEEEEAPLLSPLSPETEVKITKRNRLSLYNAHYKKQFMSLRYWIPVLWIAFQNLHVSSYMGTVSDRFPPHSDVSSNFNLIWSLGFVAIPFYGYMMDKKGVTFTLFVTTGAFVIFSGLKLIPVANLQYLSFVVVAVANTGMWGVIYSYLSEQFGFDNFGKLLGVMCVTVAVIGLLQYPLATLTLRSLNSNFLFVDIFFACTSLLSFTCPFFLRDREKLELAVRYIEHFPSSSAVNAEEPYEQK